MADPGTGEVRLDHATLASVTNIAIDATSADTGNPDVSDLIASIDDGTNSSHEGYIFIRKHGTPATFMAYNVTGAITDNTGWLQIPVSHAASGGTLSNADTLYISFARSGNVGATGATGATGGVGTELADNVFRILDNSDTSKKIAFEASGISGSTTRTITMPNSDVTLGTPLADTVTGAKIADDAIDSEHYIDGSIDTAHLAADAITGAKIADDTLDSEHYIAGSIDLEHMSSESVDEDNLHISNAGSNGNFLQKQSGNSGGLTWATAGDASLATDQSWTGSQRATLVTDNDGSFDMNAGQNFKCTPSGNFTLTFTNFADGQSGYIILVNSGGHTVALHANSKGDANIASTVSTAGTYILGYISDGTNAYLTNSAVMA